MNPDDPRKQDGKAIFDALIAFEGMPEREQPEDQERDYSGLDEDRGDLSDAEREALIQSVVGSLARDDGRDMTQELLDERREEAKKKGW